jgi:hypothetical protein
VSARIVMKARTEFRAVRGWDVIVVAAILTVVLLGWFTAADGGLRRGTRPAHTAAHACPCSRPSVASQRIWSK